MELEINGMSCKDLQSFNFFQKLQVYVVVSISTNNGRHSHKQKEEQTINLSAEEKQEQRTPVDYEDEDGSPEWKHTMRFNLSFLTNINSRTDDPTKKLFLHFQLRHHGQFFGDKVIGNVFVPFSDLIPYTAAATHDSGILRFVDYQVKSPEGKPNGVIRFSYKVAGMIGHDINHQHQLSNPIVDISGYPLHQAIHQDQDPNQQMETEAWKIQYPNIYPPPQSQPDYTNTSMTPSAPPPPAATEDHNNYYNYDSPYSTGEIPESYSRPPLYPPPRPLSMWESPPNSFPPQPYFPPPFTHHRPPPHHHPHRPFRGPHPRPWR